MHNDFQRNFEQFSEMFKNTMPQVKPNKNGYEIRTKVLEFAQNNAWQDYYAKWGQFETSVKKEHDEIVTKIEMPTVPGAEDVLQTAEKFYNFVSGKK
jgi:hypothetical protein|tara:strand:- start:250 stop:540 length:291 start_codon:yes stop_codon:yes gene_type:complete